MSRACSFCGGPDSARMIRRPYGTVCLSCAHYIDRRGQKTSALIPSNLRRSVIDAFTWGKLRHELETADYGNEGDPFEGLGDRP